MKPQVLFRQIHHWGSFIVAVPSLIIIGAGILLMLKKEIEWIQPSTEKGIELSVMPKASIADMFAAVQAVPEAGLNHWTDLDRVDFKNDKGVAKFIGTNNWEVQVDTANAKVLHVAYRRSDIIEKIHDGSFFAEWAKLGLFLPTGIVFFILWLTGMYLFILPHYKKWQKSKKKKA